MAAAGARPDPIAFRAALPFGRQALTVDAEGSARLTLELPTSEVPGLVLQWHRMQDVELTVCIVPAGDLAKPALRPGGWGRKHRTAKEAE